MTAPYGQPVTKASRLQAEAREAAEVRDALTHPDVVALRVEKVRTVVDRLICVGMVIGLLFTMTNVQQFAAHTEGFGPGSLGWWASWLLDPTVSVILLGVLFAERETSRWRVQWEPTDAWARVAKWGLLGATYVMNTWEAYAAGDVAGTVLHSVPVLAVFVGAEALTSCNDRLTRAVESALAKATERADRKAKSEREKAPAQVNEASAPRWVPTPQSPGVPAPFRPPFSAVPNLTTARPVERPEQVVSERPETSERNVPAPVPETSTQDVLTLAPVAAPDAPQNVTPGRPAGTSRGDSPGRTENRPANRPATSRRDALGKRSGKPRKLTDEQLAEAVREMAEENGGTPPTRYQVRQRLDVGDTRAARVLAELDPVPTGPPSSNGAARKVGA